MKTFSVCALMILVFTASLFGRPRSEYAKARASLEKAHTIVEQRNAGIQGANVDEILKAVIWAETHLNDGKNDRGSSPKLALQAVESAKAELESAKAAKDGEDSHVQQADEFIQQALKHVNEALQVHPAKS
jgi:hypothetical protein